MVVIQDISDIDPNHSDLKGIQVSLMRPSSIATPTPIDFSNADHQQAIEETSTKLKGFCILHTKEFMTLNSDDDEDLDLHVNCSPHIIIVEEKSTRERGTSSSTRHLSPEQEVKVTKPSQQSKPHKLLKSKRKFDRYEDQGDEDNLMIDSPPRISNQMYDDEDEHIVYSPVSKRLRHTIEL